MKKYQYKLGYGNVWSNFDYGDIEAENLENARALAIKKLKEDFKKANDAFRHCDNTKHFEIGFEEEQVSIIEMEREND